MTLGEFRDALETYCHVTGGSVTSYGRSMDRNRSVGGVALSGHRFWLAADVVYGPSPELMEQAPPSDLATEIARRVGLRLFRESDHDHLQPEDWRAG